MPTQFYGAPGIYAGPVLAARNIFANSSASQVQFFPQFAFIDGTKSRDTGNNPTSVLRAGTLLGKVTTGGLYRPSIIGLTSAAAIATATSITVNAAVATEVARLRALAGGNINITLTGPATTGVANAVNRDVVACSAASGTTLTVAATTHAFVAGSLVQPADGSDAPLVPLVDQYGEDMTDVNGLSLAIQPLNYMLRGGDLKASMLVNMVADDFATTTEPAVQAWLKTQLKAFGYFTFDNDR